MPGAGSTRSRGRKLHGEAAGGDLHLGQLGHERHVSLPRGGSVDQGGGGGDRQARAARAGGAGRRVVARRRRPRRERVRAVCAALLPGEATIERVPCSSPRARRGPRRPPARHRHAAGCCWSATSTPSSPTPSTGRCEREGEQLVGSGSVDMKGGDMLALGALRAFAHAPGALRRSSRCCSSATRSGGRADFGHVARFAGFDACLCFEAGELAGGDEGVVVRRKAAGTIHVTGARAAARTRARRRTAAATRCSRSPGRAGGRRARTTRTARRT